MVEQPQHQHQQQLTESADAAVPVIAGGLRGATAVLRQQLLRSKVARGLAKKARGRRRLDEEETVADGDDDVRTRSPERVFGVGVGVFLICFFFFFCWGLCLVSSRLLIRNHIVPPGSRFCEVRAPHKIPPLLSRSEQKQDMYHGRVLFITDNQLPCCFQKPFSTIFCCLFWYGVIVVYLFYAPREQRTYVKGEQREYSTNYYDKYWVTFCLGFFLFWFGLFWLQDLINHNQFASPTTNTKGEIEQRKVESIPRSNL